MKALVCSQLAVGFDEVSLQDVARPVPGPGQVLVRVKAASLNFPDLLMLKGAYQFKPELPFIVGMDFSGDIEELGEGVSGVGVGQRIAGGGKTGAFAEFVLVQAEGLTVVPQGIDAAVAAAYPVAYSTAYVSLVNRGGLQPGETLLVHGASGGVGLAAIDVGRLLGARVIATTAQAAKVPALKELGADHVLLLTDGFRQQVKDLTDGRGADVIFDPVGGDVFDESMRCIAFNGRLLVVGFAGGRIATAATNMPLIKGFSIVGVRAGEYSRRLPEEGRKVRDTIWGWLADGKTRPRVHAEFALDDWRSAFSMMRDRGLVGKVVLRP